MLRFTPKQREIKERYGRIMKWSDDQRLEFYEKHKELYDKLHAAEEANEDYKKWRELYFSRSFTRPRSAVSELKCEEEKREKLREKEDGEENTSSIRNNDGNQQPSSDTIESGRQYFSTDEECLLYLAKEGHKKRMEAAKRDLQKLLGEPSTSEQN